MRTEIGGVRVLDGNSSCEMSAKPTRRINSRARLDGKQGITPPRTSSPRKRMKQRSFPRLKNADQRSGRSRDQCQQGLGPSRLLTETKRAMARQGDRNGRLGNHDDGSRKLRPGAAVHQAGRWGTDPAKARSALRPINTGTH
jgi:hypothetical protein